MESGLPKDGWKAKPQEQAQQQEQAQPQTLI
jgi:hypothetical protein